MVWCGGREGYQHAVTCAADPAAQVTACQCVTQWITRPLLSWTERSVRPCSVADCPSSALPGCAHPKIHSGCAKR